MTEKTQDNEEKTQEQIAAEEKESEAGFSTGFARVRGVEPDEKPGEPEKKEEPAEPAAEVKPEEKKEAAAPDPWAGVPQVVRDRLDKIDKLSGSVDKLAGHLGGFKRQLDSMTATAKAAADSKGADSPTKVEVQEALKDPELMKQLKKDFPEWMEPIEQELLSLRGEVSKLAKSMPAAPAEQPKGQEIDTQALLDEAEERAYVRLKHPDWKEICAKKEFVEWFGKQPDDFKVKSDSKRAEDAIEIFDTWKAHAAKLATDEAAKRKKEERLMSATVPQGSGEPPSTGVSDDEAFNRGFKRVRGGQR